MNKKVDGVIIDYDGSCGTILGVDGKYYLLLNKEIIGNNIKKGDVVEFTFDEKFTPTMNKLIARFVVKK